MDTRAGKIFLGLVILSAILFIAGWNTPRYIAKDTKVPTICTIQHMRYAGSINDKPTGNHGPVKHKAPHKLRLRVPNFKTILPEQIIVLNKVPVEDDRTVILFPEVYTYLYFSEINPPPPKAC